MFNLLSGVTNAKGMAILLPCVGGSRGVGDVEVSTHMESVGTTTQLNVVTVGGIIQQHMEGVK